MLRSSFFLLKDAVKLESSQLSKLSLSSYGFENQKGIYSFSPLTLLEEATRPFYNITEYILPPLASTHVDSGPSFVILNIGLLIGIGVYIFFYQSIFSGLSKPMMFFILILLVDIKFRTILVLMPTSWVFLHILLIKKHYNSSESNIFYSRKN
jgi:hypothetical protein